MTRAAGESGWCTWAWRVAGAAGLLVLVTGVWLVVQNQPTAALVFSDAQPSALTRSISAWSRRLHEVGAIVFILATGFVIVLRLRVRPVVERRVVGLIAAAVAASTVWSIGYYLPWNQLALWRFTNSRAGTLGLVPEGIWGTTLILIDGTSVSGSWLVTLYLVHLGVGAGILLTIAAASSARFYRSVVPGGQARRRPGASDGDAGDQE